MNRQTLPDDEELARLIHAAFEALPGPDDERLAAVGERLAQQSRTQKKASRNRRHSWYWLWLLLAGGTVMAAAWWVSDVVQREEPAMSRQSAPVTGSQAASGERADVSDGNNNVTGKKNESSSDHKPGPVIYQREAY